MGALTSTTSLNCPFIKVVALFLQTHGSPILAQSKAVIVVEIGADSHNELTVVMKIVVFAASVKV